MTTTVSVTETSTTVTIDESTENVTIVQSDNSVEVKDTGVQGPSGANGIMAQLFTVPRTLTTGSGAGRFYAPRTMTISNISVYVATAPTGAAVIVDVNKNGTTIFTTQANRPTVAAGQNTSLVNSPDVDALVQGDYLSVDIDQIGSTFAGADATIQVEFESA